MMSLAQRLQRLRNYIESITKKDGPSPLFSIETVLLLLSVLYGAVMAIRASFYQKGVLPSRSLPCRVISIGNIVAGGTGKTPLTIFVARTLFELGYRVVVISRGFRGRLEHIGGIVSDGLSILVGPEDAGDEPYLIAASLKGVPVVVGADRFAAGWLAIHRFKPDVIVMDDAFQHLRLNRDLDLLLLDHRSPLGNGYLLPRGRLREPLSALNRCDAVIFTRHDQYAHSSLIDQIKAAKPIFHTINKPVVRGTHRQASDFIDLRPNTDILTLEGKKVVAFAGLANNDQFFASLESAGCELVDRFYFVDHHRYNCSQLDQVVRSAIENRADLLVTTAKDFVKIKKYRSWPLILLVMDIDVQLVEGKEHFRRLLVGAE
jgi:tetraacyldisaccharide 4'-kinase